jgi:hypothetical protein
MLPATTPESIRLAADIGGTLTDGVKPGPGEAKIGVTRPATLQEAAQ